MGDACGTSESRFGVPATNLGTPAAQHWDTWSTWDALASHAREG